MDLLKVRRTTIFVVVILICSPLCTGNSVTEMLDKEDQCIEECGGEHKIHEGIGNGESICYSVPSVTTMTYMNAYPSCVVECLGSLAEKWEDQTKCMCEHCKTDDHANFCEPGELPIGEGECEAKVCSGTAKYLGYANGCKAY